MAGIRAQPPALLGRPDEVRVIEDRVVSLGWRPAAGRPAVRLDVFDGRLEPTFAKYLAYKEGTEVDIGGLPGWYVPGPHEVVYIDRGGVLRTESARLSGPTLIWQRYSLTYRLEAALPVARLVSLAASVPT